ncbi:MAG TPA: fibronectin type III domain-containing protein, partial [bacterium]|nr:fibronectin type III domain-containing protein [bacterium]
MNWKFLVFVTLLGAALAAAGDNSISITWSRNTEPDLLGYRLHFGTRPGAYTASRDLGDVTTYTLTGLAADTTYYIALTALDHWGNESGYSNEVEAAPEGGGGGGGNPA